MLHPTRFSRAFTLIEMLVVMAVIAILAAIILSVNGLVQSKAARARAETEIKALSAGCESYKGDNGSYPQDATTDALDPRANGAPAGYNAASVSLYKALSGDTNANGRLDAATEGKNYAPDFFQPQRLGGAIGPNGAMTSVTFIKDPYGNSYGYSTIGAKAEQDYITKVKTDASAARPAVKGYNSTFDLWSTAGKTTNPIAGDIGKSKDITNIWVKNW